jgi:hypothetical protein
MKSTFTFLFMLLSIAVFAASNDSTISTTKLSQGNFTSVNDSIGVALTQQGAAFIQGDNVIGLAATESGVIKVVGVATENGIKGLSISADGEIVYINASKVVITRKSFASHEAADAALLQGEEYYLTGDRIVYRKP